MDSEDELHMVEYLLSNGDENDVPLQENGILKYLRSGREKKIRIINTSMFKIPSPL